MSTLESGILDKALFAFEQAINATLSLDPSAQKHLARLEGCVLALHTTNRHTSFYFGIAQTSDNDRSRNKSRDQIHYRVKILPEQKQSTVQVNGSALSYLKFLSVKDKALLFRTQELELSGESVRIQQIQAFLEAINIDWEALVADLIGDIPAHILGSSWRHTFSFSKNLTQSLIRDAEEFIKYELRLFPNKAAAKKQFASIDKLAEKTSALEENLSADLRAYRLGKRRVSRLIRPSRDPS